MKLVIVALGVVLSGCVSAQNTDAYIRGQVMGAQMQADMASARLARAETEGIERNDAVRASLAKAWASVGFSDKEASAIAGAYQFQPQEKAIVERAKRDGTKVTADAIAVAYQGYNYLLADQLLIGYFQAVDAERKAASASE